MPIFKHFQGLDLTNFQELEGPMGTGKFSYKYQKSRLYFYSIGQKTKYISQAHPMTP